MAGELEFMFIIWIGTFMILAVVSVLLILVSVFSPGWTFVKAKLRKKDILAGWRRDRKIDFHLTDSDDGIVGLAVSKKYKGQYFVNPDNVYVEKKSGVSIIPVNVECGAATSEKQLRCIASLRRMGCNNIKEADQYNAIYGRCECGYQGFMIPKTETDDAGKEKLVGLICPYKEEVKDETQKGSTEEDTTIDTGIGEPNIQSEERA